MEPIVTTPVDLGKVCFHSGSRLTLGSHKIMKKIIITSLIVLNAFSTFAEQADTTFKMYTIRQRQLCFTSETQHEPSGATESYELEKTELFKIFDALKVHLHSKIDLSRISERYYPQGDILFGFNQYYLQFVPFKKGSKRLVYINAYFCHCDNLRHGDEAKPKEHFVSVFDGGSNYWQIIFDLDTGKFLKIKINGIA